MAKPFKFELPAHLQEFADRIVSDTITNLIDSPYPVERLEEASREYNELCSQSYALGDNNMGLVYGAVYGELQRRAQANQS